jgi:hypothetical protein
VQSFAGKDLSLDALVQQVHTIVPALDPGHSNGAENGQQQQPLFDAKFYIMFWALEAPDLCADTAERYTAIRLEMETELRKTRESHKSMQSLYTNYQAAMHQMRNEPRMGFDQRSGRTKAEEQPVVSEGDVERTARTAEQVSRQLAALPAERDEYVARSRQWRAFIKARAQHVFNVKGTSREAVHLLMQVLATMCRGVRCRAQYIGKSAE